MSGNTYEIELRELLSICPRQRRRADAYYLLKKLLKDQYNVELVITSRTSKTNANHEKYDYAGAFVLSKDTDGICIDIAPVILDEFGEPYPGGLGDPYIINWKDGDKHNNDVSNLEWVKPVYRHSTAAQEYLYRQNNMIGVRCNGTVWCHDPDDDLRVLEYSWDNDVWLRWPHYGVFVSLDLQHPLCVENLMAECGYVQGDPYVLSNPAAPSGAVFLLV